MSCLGFTGMPSLLLVVLGHPSLDYLYSFDSHDGTGLTLKVTGHQWYWSCDYLDGWWFDSFLLASGCSLRLLEVDNHVVLPIGQGHAAVTSADVIHSFALPALGVKVDANPGRLNTTGHLVIPQPNLLYGHCRELCGINHRFMPIALESCDLVVIHGNGQPRDLPQQPMQSILFHPP